MAPAYQKISLSPFDFDKIGRAAALIAAKPGRETGSRVLSIAVNLSEHKLKAGFKRKYQLTLQQYLFRARMEAATRLLQTTDLPLKAIAHQVGYKNKQYFITVFRKHYGETPGAFRRRPLR